MNYVRGTWYSLHGPVSRPWSKRLASAELWPLHGGATTVGWLLDTAGAYLRPSAAGIQSIRDLPADTVDIQVAVDLAEDTFQREEDSLPLLADIQMQVDTEDSPRHFCLLAHTEVGENSLYLDPL